jgi:hypothetical protein
MPGGPGERRRGQGLMFAAAGIGTGLEPVQQPEGEGVPPGQMGADPELAQQTPGHEGVLVSTEVRLQAFHALGKPDRLGTEHRHDDLPVVADTLGGFAHVVQVLVTQFIAGRVVGRVEGCLDTVQAVPHSAAQLTTGRRCRPVALRRVGQELLEGHRLLRALRLPSDARVFTHWRRQRRLIVAVSR